MTPSPEQSGGRLPAASWLRRLPLLLLLLFTAVSGIRNSLGEYRGAATGGQKFATAAELAYGIASFPALAGLLRRKGWTRPAAVLWAGLVTLTAAVASDVWGGAGLGAACAAGVAVAATCGLPIWLAFPRPRPASEATTGSK